MFLFLMVFIITFLVGIHSLPDKKPECSYHSWVYKESIGLQCSKCDKIAGSNE